MTRAKKCVDVCTEGAFPFWEQPVAHRSATIHVSTRAATSSSQGSTVSSLSGSEYAASLGKVERFLKGGIRIA